MTIERPMFPPRGPMAEAWHRRHAIMLASQLPEDLKDARIILRLAEELVNGLLDKSDSAPKAAQVVTLVAGPGDVS
jgi:hypothetical protein